MQEVDILRSLSESYSLIEQSSQYRYAPITDADGNKTWYTIDKNGNKTKITDPKVIKQAQAQWQGERRNQQVRADREERRQQQNVHDMARERENRERWNWFDPNRRVRLKDGQEVTIGNRYRATQGGQQGFVTYDKDGNKTFTAGDPNTTPGDRNQETNQQRPSPIQQAQAAIQQAPAAVAGAAQQAQQQAGQLAQQAQQAVTGAAQQAQQAVTGAAGQVQQAAQSATTPRETQATQQTQTQTQRPAQTPSRTPPKPQRNKMTSKIGTDFSDVGGRLGAALRDTQNAIASEEFDLDAILDAMAVGLEEGKGLSGDKDDYQKMRDRNANAGMTPGNTYATAQRRMRSGVLRGKKKEKGAKPATPKHLTPAQELAHRTGMTKANLAAKHSGTAAGRRQIANNQMDAAERGTSGNRGS